MKRRLVVAVLGLGVMGRQHLRVITALPDVTVAGACDHSPEARQWASRYSRAPVFDDWRQLLSLQPDAVVNALPTGLHSEVSRSFLERGVHVLVEKPIATTLDEAKQLETIASRMGVVLMVGHVERFNPVVDALDQLIAADRLGGIISVSARRLGVARPTVPHANVVLDLAIHDIDVLAHLLRNEGRLLLATGASLGTNLLEDHADLVIKYGATTAWIQANWITPIKIRRLSLTGSRGFVEADYVDQTIRLFETVPEVIMGMPWDFFAVSRESDAVNIPVPRYEPLRAELEHFVTCIRTGCAPMTDPTSAMRALALAVEATTAIRGVSPVVEALDQEAATGH